MLGGPKRKIPASDKKKEEVNDTQSFHKKVAEFEARIEGLQKVLKDRDNAIIELKEKNVKQEKKIDAQIRARLVKEKDATIAELKERVRKQQQRKDDQTRARLAHADSPVTKAVLDRTLQENKELHLRIEAVLLQVHEERKKRHEMTQLNELLKAELEIYMSKNSNLERELDAARADIKHMRLQVAQMQALLSQSSPEPLKSPKSNAASSPEPDVEEVQEEEEKEEKEEREDGVTLEANGNSTSNISTSPPTTTHTTTTTTTTHNHTPPASKHESDSTPTSSPPHHASQSPSSSSPSPSHTLPSDPTSPRETATPPKTPRSIDPESYDLHSLAKDLDASAPYIPLSPTSSELELMKSLDSMAPPVKALDFSSLAHNTQIHEAGKEPDSGFISPTTKRQDVRHPLLQHSLSAYDEDFMEMFNPPNHANLVKIKHFSPVLDNLFYNEDTKSTPPDFNLDGIDGAYLNNFNNNNNNNNSNENSNTTSNKTNHEPLSPSHRPTSPSHSLSQSESALPTIANAHTRAPSPAAASLTHAPLHRSTSTPSPPPHALEESPARVKGHKSIFSVFRNDDNDTNGINSSTDSLPTSDNDRSSPLHRSPTLPPPKPHPELLLNFGSKVDINRAGLRRAKKINFETFATKGKVKVEPTMEDVHFCIYPYTKTKKRALFAVFDGHAGRAAADQAANLFPKEFSTQLELFQNDISQAFLKTFALVDDAMKEFEYVGTTATVVYLWQNGESKFLQAANVGDSTAFLCRNGVAVKLTVDHKPSLMEEKERMRLAGVEISDSQTRINGLAVSRSLGNHFVKEQNIGMIATPFVSESIEILPTDSYLIVASDGLWDVVNSQLAMDIIRGMDALPAASLLLSTALSSSKCTDNVSIIVARLN